MIYKYHILSFFTIVILSVLIYSNTFHASFHYDDFSAFVANPATHMRDLSIRNLLDFWWMDRPFAQLTFGLNYYFGGLEVRGYHIVNITIHIIAAVVLYLFLYKTFNLPILMGKYGKDSGWISLLSSLLWLSSPVQTQAVAYVVQRMTSMASLFYVLCLLFYAKGRLSFGSKRWFYWSFMAASFFLSLGSKEYILTFPVVAVVYEVCFFQRGDLARLKDASTYIILAAIVLLTVAVIYLFDLFVFLPSTGFPLKERVYTESRVIIYYVTLLLFPLPERMSLNYEYPLSRTIFVPITTLFSLSTLAALLVYAVYRIKRLPLVSFFILWFIITVSTEAMVIGLELVFEHRLYLPSMSFFPLLISVCLEISGREGRIRKLLFVICGIIIIVGYSINTYRRNSYWVDDYSIYADSVRKYPGSFQARMNLGTYYLNKDMPDEAIIQFGKAKEMDPMRPDVLWYLGNSYFKRGEYDKAAVELESAIEYGGNWFEVYGSLGDAYTKGGKLDQAEMAYQKALELAPGRVEQELTKTALESVRRKIKGEKGND